MIHKWGLELSDESLAKLNEQYAAYEKLGTFRDNGVEVYGAYRALDYPLSSIQFTASDLAQSGGTLLTMLDNAAVMAEERLAAYEIGLGVEIEDGNYEPSSVRPNRSIAVKIPLPQDCDVEALNGHMRAYILTEESPEHPIRIGSEYIYATERNGEKYLTLRTSQVGFIAVYRAEPLAFTDVAEDAYYYDAVLWAVDNAITAGTGDGTTFSPDNTCTRAQIVTFLYNLSQIS